MDGLNNKAVVLGSSYYISLSTIRSLGIEKIYTVSMAFKENDGYADKSKYIDEKYIVPHYKDDTEAFINYLIEYARKQDKKPVLIPCHDSYLEVIDEYFCELKKYYLLPQTTQGLYTELMDKGTLAKLAERKGMKIPETVHIGEEDFYKKIDEIVTYPCLVKPIDSPSFVEIFRKKLFKVNTKEELDYALKQAKDVNQEVIVQRIIPGFDDHMYTYDAYLNQESKVTHWATFQKLRQFPINFGASVYTRQHYVPKLNEIGAKFLEEIQYKGFAEIEFKKDAKTGEFYLIEINVRITNFNQLLTKLGLNIPHIMYQELIGAPLPPKFINKTTNRAFIHLMEDTFAIRDYLATKQLSVFQVIKSYFRPKAYAIWDWKDMKPVIHYNKNIVKRIFKKVFRRPN